MRYLKQMYASSNLKIAGLYGNSPAVNFDDVDLAICTIEKANSLINKILEEGKAGSLGIVVVDELHMIGDESRGYLLELLLTKIKFVLGESVQIVGMSATLPNIETLAKWYLYGI
jgi:replicative superfamily II helicase